jgi:hypothetical protein
MDVAGQKYCYIVDKSVKSILNPLIRDLFDS